MSKFPYFRAKEDRVACQGCGKSIRNPNWEDDE